MQNSSNLVSFLVFLSFIQFSLKSSSVYYFFPANFQYVTLTTNFESFKSNYTSAHQISKQTEVPMKNPAFILAAIHLHENSYRTPVVHTEMIYMQTLIQRPLTTLTHLVSVFGGVPHVCDIFMVVRNILYLPFIIKHYITGRFDVFDFCYKCKVTTILSDLKQIKTNRSIERIYTYYILNALSIFIINQHA